MLFLLNLPLAVASVVYSTYVYMSLDQNMLGIWHVVFYPSITLVAQVCVSYSSLTTAFPSVLYDTSDYERPQSLTIATYALTFALVALVAKIFFLSILYVDSLEDSAMLVLYQIISFLMLTAVTVAFLVDSLQYCSGWAYCDYLKHHNHPEVQYAFFPFTLPTKEMEAYLGERYIARRAHTV